MDTDLEETFAALSNTVKPEGFSFVDAFETLNALANNDYPNYILRLSRLLTHDEVPLSVVKELNRQLKSENAKSQWDRVTEDERKAINDNIWTALRKFKYDEVEEDAESAYVSVFTEVAYKQITKNACVAPVFMDVAKIQTAEVDMDCLVVTARILREVINRFGKRTATITVEGLLGFIEYIFAKELALMQSERLLVLLTAAAVDLVISTIVYMDGTKDFRANLCGILYKLCDFTSQNSNVLELPKIINDCIVTIVKKHCKDVAVHTLENVIRRTRSGRKFELVGFITLCEQLFDKQKRLEVPIKGSFLSEQVKFIDFLNYHVNLCPSDRDTLNAFLKKVEKY